MTQHYDYALLSDFVYKLGDDEYKKYDKNPEDYSNNKGYIEYEKQKNEISKNWKLISTSQDYNIGTDVDYFGATFEHIDRSFTLSNFSEEEIKKLQGLVENTTGKNNNLDKELTLKIQGIKIENSNWKKEQFERSETERLKKFLDNTEQKTLSAKLLIDTKQIVIAHRGTIINFSGPSPNVIEDLKIFGRKIPELILKPCIDYIIKALVETEANNNTKITMTGHSLGGYLAGVSTLFFRAETDYQKIKAVTFDSIGIKAFLDEFKKDLNQQQTAKLNNIEDNILNYLSSPNIINTIVEHIGKNRRLFIENDETDNIRKYLLPTFQDQKEKNTLFLSLGELDRINNISLPISLLDIMTTAMYSHPMANFLSAFDKEGGFPKGNYGKITQWPSGNYGFFDREPKYTSTNYIEDKYEKSFQKPFKLMKTPEFIEQKIRPVMNSMIPMIPIFGLLFNVNTDRQSEDEYSSEEANNINLNP